MPCLNTLTYAMSSWPLPMYNDTFRHGKCTTAHLQAMLVQKPPCPKAPGAPSGLITQAQQSSSTVILNVPRQHVQVFLPHLSGENVAGQPAMLSHQHPCVHSECAMSACAGVFLSPQWGRRRWKTSQGSAAAAWLPGQQH